MTKATTDTPARTFVEFWSVYPLRTAKGAALKAWDKALARGVPAAQIYAGAVRYRDDPARKPDFTAHPSTWLNQERWLDQPIDHVDHGPMRTASPRSLSAYQRIDVINAKRLAMEKKTKVPVSPADDDLLLHDQLVIRDGHYETTNERIFA